MARYKPGRQAETHDRIVSGASTMIRERGLDRASVAEVMKAAGLTVGGFYAQFDDKDAMLAEAMRLAIAPSEKRFGFLTGLAAEKADVGVIAERYLAVERVAELGNGCAAAALVSELHRAPDGVRSAFADGAEAAASTLSRAVPQDADEAEAAWGAYAMLIGALALMRAMPDEARREAIRTRVIKDLRKLAAKA